jgi:hypothetical protein
LLFAISGERGVNMPDHTSNRRGEFDSLLSEAKAFFEEAANQPIGVSRIQEFSWLYLSSEQKIRADDLRRRLRLSLAALVPGIQTSPLLDKRDLRRFSRLGRTMDAALRFETFRQSEAHGLCPDASYEFRESSREIAELLDLVPEAKAFEERAVAAEPKVG